MININIAKLIFFVTFVQLVSAEDINSRKIDSDGTIHVPAFKLPESAFLGSETKAALKIEREIGIKTWESMDINCTPFSEAKMADMPAIRQCRADLFYSSLIYQNMRSRYADVQMTPQIIDGVYTEVFSPSQGVHKKNKNKVLINLHGGGFTFGSRSASHLESIPIAAIGKIKVVSIDYRMAPEYKFPAASEDVEKVYRELLKQYKPDNIGLYGCSAGAAIAAQSLARFIDNKLPLPAAVGMFCAGAPRKDWVRTDLAKIGGILIGLDFDLRQKHSHYLSNVSAGNYLAYPGASDQYLKKFPPALLIGATRDFALGPIVKTHTDLRRLGVEAELFIWEGLSHAFIYNSEITESREAYNVIVDYFEKHLSE